MFTAVGALVTGALFVSPAAAVTPQPAQSSTPCQYRTAPPPPVDASEQPKPGQPSPTPLPVPTKPVGGDRLGECGLVLPEGAPQPPEDVHAENWLIADLDTGAVLAAKDPHGRQRPASAIKVLTALVALRELAPETTIEATEEDAAIEGTKVGLVPGVEYTAEQLVQALIMASGNDAANALARALGGTDETVEKMNQLAKELGALDTRAATPSGLDGPGMTTSAYDLALIYRRAMANPQFAKAVSTKRVTLPGRGQRSLTVANDNKLLTNYKGALGGKTGFTDDAQHTFIGAAAQDGRRLVVVVLRTQKRPLEPWQQGAKLLDYGFALSKSNSERVGELVDSAPKDALSTGPVPQPAADPQQPQPQATGDEITAFGTVGAPLTIAAGVGTVVVGILWVRQRRAAARRRAAAAAAAAAVTMPIPRITDN
ncbi:MAG TPA: serine hydrolase [Pseudonocardiaceae bacterium]